MVIVILNYTGLLPGGVNNLWLVAAIAAIFVGLIMATRYHCTSSGRPSGRPAPAQPRRSMMVALAMPPPSHMVRSP